MFDAKNLFSLGILELFKSFRPSFVAHAEDMIVVPLDFSKDLGIKLHCWDNCIDYYTFSQIQSFKSPVNI
jgi:hypothetical protein